MMDPKVIKGMRDVAMAALQALESPLLDLPCEYEDRDDHTCSDRARMGLQMFRPICHYCEPLVHVQQAITCIGRMGK